MSTKERLVNEELIERLSWLSRIKLSVEERERLSKEIVMILGYIDDILSLDVGNEEITHLSEGRLREDSPIYEIEMGRELLGQAILEEGYVKGPKVFKG
ncbi:MAG: Asp-tRNA(Asn)/Glu-tRNA(Gln) amidotransferase subunit GatC [Fervidicoccaceae archaeon]|jgi:aspartyl/glutamyl-tRNA(Asn/Gln) amidotransferase C subunit|uniref:Asp-tRNA(Asn) amidotransferase GatCAB subunit C n=1 Tax=Fervidicoccus fontis TaxID=683846 RepID=A0A7C2UU85_9CREN|nr:MAG: Asp-tRNA(Asn) amidotransferase GatCAB subunit C [Fervidicoccus sp.]HEU97643.1 Asp-tRNA(Asn) amidotransferase GatCAB subunit C [Fervidicoccus fontis]